MPFSKKYPHNTLKSAKNKARKERKKGRTAVIIKTSISRKPGGRKYVVYSYSRR